MNNYEILGLKKGASLKEIKAKFRELAKINHPDKGGDAKKFIVINTAYEALLKGDAGEVDYGMGGQKQRAYQQSQQRGNPYDHDQTSEAYWNYEKQTNYRHSQQQAAKPKTATYRFEGIKKDEEGYLVSFFVDGVDNIEIYGKDFNKIGYYTVAGRTGTVNLSVKWEDAKRGKYVFECWLHDGRGKMAKKTYKVEPPKKPTVWDKVRSGIKNLFK